MAQVNDYICDTCGLFCSTVEIDGIPLPLVLYVAAGVPPDYPGEPINLNAPGVKVPAMVRDVMARPIPRMEFCVKCFARTFGLDLVEAPAPTPAPLEAPRPEVRFEDPPGTVRSEAPESTIRDSTLEEVADADGPVAG